MAGTKALLAVALVALGTVAALAAAAGSGAAITLRLRLADGRVTRVQCSEGDSLQQVAEVAGLAGAIESGEIETLEPADSSCRGATGNELLGKSVADLGLKHGDFLVARVGGDAAAAAKAAKDASLKRMKEDMTTETDEIFVPFPKLARYVCDMLRARPCQ